MKRHSSTFLSGWIMVVCIMSFAAWCLAAEFSAEMTSNQMGKSMKSTIYIKGDKMRTEGTGPRGESSIMIMDTQKKVMYTLMPEEKMYLEMSGFMGESEMSQFEAEEEISKIADKQHMGTETVNGYLCDKYEIIYHDTSRGTMTQWFSKKLNYPIKIVYHHPSGDMVTEYKNIKEGGLNDSLFTIPAGYQKMAMPGMGQGMGMMRRSMGMK